MAARPESAPVGTMFVVTAAASLVAMFFVAPITQHQSFLFLLLGAASACIRSSRIRMLARKTRDPRNVGSS